MREDSAEETSRPTIVLARVKAPLAPLMEDVEAADALPEEPALSICADTLVEPVSELLLDFESPLPPEEEVVMVVLPCVIGNRVDDPLALTDEDIQVVKLDYFLSIFISWDCFLAHGRGSLDATHSLQLTGSNTSHTTNTPPNTPHRKGRT